MNLNLITLFFALSVLGGTAFAEDDAGTDGNTVQSIWLHYANQGHWEVELILQLRQL